MEEYMETNYITSLDQALTTEQKDTLFKNLGLPIKVHNDAYIHAHDITLVGNMENLNVSLLFTEPSVSETESRIGKLYLATKGEAMDVIVNYKTYRLDYTPGASDLYLSGHQVMHLARSNTVVDNLDICYILIKSGEYEVTGSITEVDVFNGSEVYHVYITANPDNESIAGQDGKFAITITK